MSHNEMTLCAYGGLCDRPAGDGGFCELHTPPRYEWRCSNAADADATERCPRGLHAGPEYLRQIGAEADCGGSACDGRHKGICGRLYPRA